MTVLDLITQALRELSVIAALEPVSAEDAQVCLDKLNQWIDMQSANRLQIYQSVRTTFSLVSGTQDYTVGTGGTVNVARPVFVDRVEYQDTSLSPTQERRLVPLTDDAWRNLTIKGLTSPLPTSYYYNPTFPLGTLSYWPIPTSSTLQGVLYAPQAVAEFASLSPTISLPPGYREMLITNLAVAIAASFTRQPSETLVAAAAKSLEVVERANFRMTDLSMPAGALIQGRGGSLFDAFMTGQ